MCGLLNSTRRARADTRSGQRRASMRRRRPAAHAAAVHRCDERGNMSRPGTGPRWARTGRLRAYAEYAPLLCRPLTGDVVDHHGDGRVTDVARNQTPESLLPGSIPQLEPDLWATPTKQRAPETQQRVPFASPPLSLRALSLSFSPPLPPHLRSVKEAGCVSPPALCPEPSASEAVPSGPPGTSSWKGNRSQSWPAFAPCTRLLVPGTHTVRKAAPNSPSPAAGSQVLLPKGCRDAPGMCCRSCRT